MGNIWVQWDGVSQDLLLKGQITAPSISPVKMKHNAWWNLSKLSREHILHWRAFWLPEAEWKDSTSEQERTVWQEQAVHVLEHLVEETRIV